MSEPYTLVELPTSAPKDRMMTLDTAWQMLGISRARLYQLLEAGTLKSYRLGRKRLIRESEILEFMDSLPAIENGVEA